MADLLKILQDAGFSGSGLQTAYAVAMAESGGNARAHNPDASTGDNSYGLFQINMLGGMGPERRSAYGLSSNEDLFNAEQNAKVAYQMSKGGSDWSPWSTYKNGAYKQYLGQTGAPVSGGSTGGASSAAAQPAAGQTKADIVASPGGGDFAPNAGDFAPGVRDFANPVGDPGAPTAASGQPAQTARYSGGGTNFRDRVVANAMSFLGTPYSWGGGTKSGTSFGIASGGNDGRGVNGVDCSGLMLAAFGLAGYDLPRVSQAQLGLGSRASLDSLQPGDFIGYRDGGHIAMYIGDGQLIEAPRAGLSVRVRALSDYDRQNGWGVHLNLPGD